MNRLSADERAHVLHLLCEGMSIRAITRLTGASKNTVIKLLKQYGPAPSPPGRYSPAVCTGARLVSVEGNPDPKHISTSYVERQNLTMRMHMRRFTRLTNGFSKKLENHANAIALHFAYYNF